MRHVFNLMALSWLGLAIQWASVDEWAHAALTFTAGVVTYGIGEYCNRPKADRRD